MWRDWLWDFWCTLLSMVSWGTISLAPVVLINTLMNYKYAGQNFEEEYFEDLTYIL